MPAIELVRDLSGILRATSKSAHMFLLMYRRHGTALCSAQLFNDYQCCAKDLFATVAKTQIGNAEGVISSWDFHPYHAGSDRQEQQFSGVRTITHDRSVNLMRLCDRLGAVTQLEDVFERRPELKRQSRRLSIHANDRINVHSTIGCRSTKDVMLRSCWEGGRSDAIAALNSHSAYSGVSLGSFAAAGTEPGVTMVRPHGVRVGVTLSAEEINDEREVGNGASLSELGVATAAVSEAANAPAASPDDPSSLLEEVLDGTTSPADIDGPGGTIMMDGQRVCKASAYRAVFGKGSAKSNDRLKRVRGIGRARCGLESTAEADETDEADMAGVVCLMDIVAVIAAIDNCEALCLAVVEELRMSSSVESELTLSELRQSGTKATLRLAVVTEVGGALHVSGAGVPYAAITVEGLAVIPVSFTASDSYGVAFDLAELRAMAVPLQPGDAGSRKFPSGKAQHLNLVVSGTVGMGAATSAANTIKCRLCPFECEKVRMRGHSGGHILDGSASRAARRATNGEASTGPELLSLCGWCCGPLTEGLCLTTVAKAGKQATTKFVSNCPLFPGATTQYTSAAKSTTSSPCSNVPILCDEGTCSAQKVQFWRYNIAAHYSGAHAGLRITPMIVRALGNLAADSSAEGVQAAAIATSDPLFDSHLNARSSIGIMAAEFSAVVSSINGAKGPKRRHAEIT